MSIISLDKLKQYKSLRDDAVAEIQKAEKALKAGLAKDIAALEKTFNKALKEIQKEYVKLGIVSKATEEKAPKEPKTEVAKLTDAEIKAGLDELFKKEQKLKSKVIFQTLNISRGRFNQFLEANVNYLKIEGVKKNTLYVKR